MQQFITRPTVLGLALVAASVKAINSQGGSITNPSVPWPARRVALTEGRIGTVSERAISYPKRSK
jgi:hypothetical protein